MQFVLKQEQFVCPSVYVRGTYVPRSVQKLRTLQKLNAMT